MPIAFRLLLSALAAVLAGSAGAAAAVFVTWYACVLLNLLQPGLMQIGWILLLIAVPAAGWHSATVAAKNVWSRTGGPSQQPPARVRRGNSHARSLAKIVLTNLQRVRPPVHEYREVDGTMFPHVSQAFYQRTTAELEELGFHLLGDIEDVTLSRHARPNPRTFIRTMVDADRTTVAAFYHIAPVLPWRLAMLMMRIPAQVVEFESLTLDGIYQTTSNAPASTQEPRPDSMRADYAPRSLSAADLYRRHRENVEALNAPLHQAGSLRELIAAQVEQQARIRAHLQSIGWVTPDYLRAQGIRQSDVEAVYNEIQWLLEEGFDESPHTADAEGNAFS